MKLINLECGLGTSNEVNLRLVPRLVFLGRCTLHLEPGNGLDYGNFVKNGGSRSKKCDLSEVNQLGTWSWYLIREILRVSVPMSLCLEKSSLGYVLNLSLRVLDLEPPCLTKFSYIKPFSGQKWGMVVQKNTKQVRNAYGLHLRYQDHIPSWLTSHKPHFMDLKLTFLTKFR